jgi:hypothetical protein
LYDGISSVRAISRTQPTVTLEHERNLLEVEVVTVAHVSTAVAS